MSRFDKAQKSSLFFSSQYRKFFGKFFSNRLRMFNPDFHFLICFMIARYENCMGKLQLFSLDETFICETWLALCYFFSYLNFLIFHDFTTLGSWMETRLHTTECNIRISDLESSAAQKTRLLSTWIGNGMEMKKKSHEALNDGKKTKSTQCNAEEVSSPSREPQLLSVHEKNEKKKNKNLQWNSNNKLEPKRFVYTARATTLARRRREESGGWRGLSLDAPRGRWRRLSTLKLLYGEMPKQKGHHHQAHIQ